MLLNTLVGHILIKNVARIFIACSGNNFSGSSPHRDSKNRKKMTTFTKISLMSFQGMWARSHKTVYVFIARHTRACLISESTLDLTQRGHKFGCQEWTQIDRIYRFKFASAVHLKIYTPHFV